MLLQVKVRRLHIQGRRHERNRRTHTSTHKIHSADWNHLSTQKKSRWWDVHSKRWMPSIQKRREGKSDRYKRQTQIGSGVQSRPSRPSCKTENCTGMGTKKTGACLFRGMQRRSISPVDPTKGRSRGQSEARLRLREEKFLSFFFPSRGANMASKRPKRPKRGLG